MTSLSFVVIPCSLETKPNYEKCQNGEIGQFSAGTFLEIQSDIK